MSRNAAGLMTYHKAVIGVVAFILVLPIVATVLYAFSSSWGATILPDGLTFRWFAQLLTDPRFLAALGRSLLICFATLIVSTLLVLPMIFAVFYYFPKLKGIMEVLIILPFAVPPVVSSVGFMRIILPNLNRALLASLFISFSFLMGEFVFANMLVGTRYETLQVYLYTKRMTSGHLNAAIVSTYFFLTLIMTWAAMRFSRSRREEAVAEEE